MVLQLQLGSDGLMQGRDPPSLSLLDLGFHLLPS
jgi:hypothetical protein